MPKYQYTALGPMGMRTASLQEWLTVFLDAIRENYVASMAALVDQLEKVDSLEVYNTEWRPETGVLVEQAIALKTAAIEALEKRRLALVGGGGGGSEV